MDWMDQTPDAAATRAASQHLAAPDPTVSKQPSLFGADFKLNTWEQLSVATGAPA
jgi:hypothetical protein